MQIGAKIYVTAVCVAGCAGLIAALIGWSWPDPWRFLAYCLITSVAAGIKITLPGLRGTLPLGYIFVLASIVETSALEAMVVGIIAAVIPMVWRAQERVHPAAVGFQASVAVVAVASVYQLYHHSLAMPSAAFRLAVTACVYFAVSTLATSAVDSLGEHKPLFRVWRSAHLWSFPYYLLGSALSALVTYCSGVWGWAYTLIVLPVLYVVFKSYRLYLRQLEGQKAYAEEMASLHLRTIEALALAIEAKDQTTGEHLRRVQVYAREIGKDLGLTEDERIGLQAASILHDIGKLAVPDYIISKPGRLTPEEFEKMKIHPIVGAEILETIHFPYPVVPIVRAHHEKWDGSGYPFGLKGEEIPIGARILTCVDCFDALASDRQYRRALPLDAALELVQAESGKSFDPRVVAVLSERYLKLEQMAGDEPAGESKRLSTEMRIVRGAAPDAGFQAESPVLAPPEPSSGVMPKVAEARQEMHSLYEVMQLLGDSLNLREMLSMLAERVRLLVPYDGIAIYLREDQVLQPKYVNGENYGLFSSLRIPLGQGLSGWVAENHKPILNGNPSVEPGYLNDPSKFSVLSSGVAVPLEAPGGCIGVLALYALEKDAFSREHLRILEAISAKMTAAIERLSSQVTGVPTTTDRLTSLPTASSLYVRLESDIESANADGKELSVLVFDLDGFEEINHQLGQATGDRVLQEVGAVLSRSGFVGRMGGDEFVAVLPDCSRATATSLIEDFERSVGEVGVRMGLPSVLTVSIGAATFPHDGRDSDTLLALADRSVTVLKRTKRRATPASENALANLARSVDASGAFARSAQMG